MRADLLHPRLRVRSPSRLCLVKCREFVVVRRLLVRRLVVYCPLGLLHFLGGSLLQHQGRSVCASLPKGEKQLVVLGKELEQKKEQEEKAKKKKTKMLSQGIDVESDEGETHKTHQEEDGETTNRKMQHRQEERNEEEL